jgi:hypothetical protein
VGEEAAEDKQTLQVGVDGCSFPSFLNFNLYVLTLKKKFLLHYDLLIEEEFLPY